jgi:NADP-dependent 3-hydroxy acid dehydrogenase YdfG
VDVEGAVAVVTGASAGIGEAIARALNAAGASVVLAARRAERLEALAAELPGSLALPTDVTDDEQVRRLVHRTMDVYGRLDVLVANAGQGLHVPVEEIRPDDLAAVFDLNVIGPLRCLQAALPVMREQGAGAVVFVSSATTLQAVPGLGGYAATKAALDMLGAVARAELASSGVTVSVVLPRITATDFHDNLRAGHLGRWGTRGDRPAGDPPELPARAVLFAIETGAGRVLTDDPPRVLDDGR